MGSIHNPPIPTWTPTRGERFRTAVANITLSLFLMLVIVFLCTLYYPWNPITKLEIAIVGEPHAGGILAVDVSYCKTRSWTPREVRWALLNDISIILPLTSFTLPVGCSSRRVLLPIPVHVAPGDYKLQTEVIYEPWPWRTFVYVAETPAAFQVAPARPQ